MAMAADILNRLFDGLTAPLRDHPAWAMLWLSLLTAVWALLLFKASTNQRKLATRRRRLLGHIYELGLYQDHLSVMARIQRDLAVANLRYLAVSLPALLVLMVPMILTLAQLNARFEHRGLRVGESSLVTATVAENHTALVDALTLDPPAGVVVETPPVRNHRAGKITWRVRVQESGIHDLAVVDASQGRWTKQLVAAPGLRRLARVREQQGWHHLFLNPAEKALPAESSVTSIALTLPAREIRYASVSLHWLVAFSILSLSCGLALKRATGVEV